MDEDGDACVQLVFVGDPPGAGFVADLWSWASPELRTSLTRDRPARAARFSLRFPMLRLAGRAVRAVCAGFDGHGRGPSRLAGADAIAILTPGGSRTAEVEVVLGAVTSDLHAWAQSASAPPSLHAVPKLAVAWGDPSLDTRNAILKFGRLLGADLLVVDPAKDGRVVVLKEALRRAVDSAS